MCYAKVIFKYGTFEINTVILSCVIVLKWLFFPSTRQNRF